MNFSRRESLAELWRLAEQDEVSRRNFVKLLGASMALAGVDACTRLPADHILPYSDQPELTPGIPQHYATAMTIDGFATGLLVESHDGRPIKIEGNPDHPASLGATGVFEQASVLQLFDPHRARHVRQGRETTSWSAFTRAFAPDSLRRRVGARGEGLRLLLEPTSSPLEIALLQRIEQMYPEAAIHFYAPLAVEPGSEPFRVGSRAMLPQYELDAADIIIAVDSDFLSRGPFNLRYARQFASRRRPDSPNGMNRLYVIEPSVTITGSAADHRLAVRPSEIDGLVERLLAVVSNATIGTASSTPETVTDRFIGALAKDLGSHRGRSVVIGGDHLGARTNGILQRLNETLGNVDRTVSFIESPLAGAGDARHSLMALVDVLRAGAVDTLVCIGGNPSYATAGDVAFSELLRKVPQRVYAGLYENETARDCAWMIPTTHYLESWGDARAYDGTLSIVQPLLTPLYGGRTTAELLAALAGEQGRTAYGLLRAEWARRGETEESWRSVVGRGVAPNTRASRATAPSLGTGAPAAPTASPSAKSGVQIIFAADARVHDGRFADNGWLQELPEPITTLAWGNAAWMSEATARRLQVETDDVLRLRANNQSIEIPALVVPGHADDVVSLHLGYGRTGGERTAEHVGTNVYPLRRSGTAIVVAEAARTGRRESLAITQPHWSLEPHVPARSMPLAEAQREQPKASSRVLSLYEPPRALPDGPARNQWAMTIDLSACIGCGACAVACQAENNVPVVGVDEVRKGREMHWLRIDRYIGAATDTAGTNDVIVQPMLCQQCEKAPCEYVCPVEATVHSPDGLNEMIYNRCVGTRFCSNNCPYKVRRFNWFDYNAHLDPTEVLAKNPDVTVRERGVMEKCTFCVQRIRQAEISASAEGRDLRTDEVQTACQQACPTKAIVFGSLTDPDAAVLHGRDSARGYDALEELGTLPRVRYLARVRNPNPELAKVP